MASHWHATCPVHADFDPLSSDVPRRSVRGLGFAAAGETPVFYAPSIDYYVVTRLR